MIIYLLKGSFQYCFGNRQSLRNLIILMLLFVVLTFALIFQMVFMSSGVAIFVNLLILFLFACLSLGYGLTITHNLIYGGEELPKVSRKTLLLGIKGIPVFVVYSMIQCILLDILSVMFKFPPFDLHDVILNYTDTLREIYVHNPINTLLFFAVSIVVFYVTVFFMEIALAQLADSGKLSKAFDFRLIVENIGKIGWKNYVVDYTCVVLSMVILTYVSHLADSLPVLNFVVSFIVSMLLFTIEFGAIGIVFRQAK